MLESGIDPPTTSLKVNNYYKFINKNIVAWIIKFI